jgi:murein DD-endopeptidase MepM/ murein hydrolase activator NlpD
MSLLQRNHRVTFPVLVLSVLVGFVLPGSATAAGRGHWTIRHYPTRVVNGSPILFQVKAPGPVQSLQGSWEGHELTFKFQPETKAWYAIGGVGLTTRPGTYALEVIAETTAGRSTSFRQQIRVLRAKYRTVGLVVPTKFTEPDAAQLELIHKDQELKKQVFLRTSSEAAWSTQFRPPVEAPISDNFGTERTFNGKVQSVHQGLDYRVLAGTPVSAVNDGTVILAQPLYYEGNCVVIDHGQGLLSIYMHLSEIQVTEGNKVERGQVVGLSGATGRATGAHLHVAVRWQGIYLDPAVLFALPLPKS